MKRILIPFLSILFLSCQQGSKQSDANVMCFQLDTLQTTVVNPVCEVKYVPLEVVDNSLVGSVDKILYRNKHFYIFDKSFNKGVLLFSEDGKFVKSLYRLGEGPGEYIEPIDFDVDAVGNVYIADNAHQKIIRYDANDFNRYEEMDMGCYFMEFAVIDNEHIILSEIYGEGKIKNKLAFYSRKEKKIQSLLPSALTDMDEQRVPRGSSHYLYRSGENVHYYQRFTPEIYTMHRKSIDTLVSLYSDKYFKEEELKELEGKPQLFMTDMKHIKDVNAFYEMADGYFGSLCTFPLPQFFWISKAEGSIRSLNLIQEDGLLGNMTIKGVAGEYIICCSSYSEETVRAALKLKGLTKETKQMFSNWSADDNPLLVLFRIAQ